VVTLGTTNSDKKNPTFCIFVFRADLRTKSNFSPILQQVCVYCAVRTGPSCKVPLSSQRSVSQQHSTGCTCQQPAGPLSLQTVQNTAVQMSLSKRCVPRRSEILVQSNGVTTVYLQCEQEFSVKVTDISTRNLNFHIFLPM
jgi:hypothetical protein